MPATNWRVALDDQCVTVKGIFNGELGAELKFFKLVKVE
jgi:hypothetical protein